MYIVTGGSHGIGRAAAEQLAASGHSVLITGRDAAAGQATAAAILGCRYLQADVSSEADCRRLVDHAMELGQGRIRGLVNNAGIGRRKRFAETSVADWDELMTVNARSVYLMTRLALPGLIAARGAVVNVSSVAGRGGEEELSLYAASKSALIGFTQSLALELGDQVRFNVVCPGQIATRMMQRVVDDPSRLAETTARIPAGRLADPAEVGAVIAWLLSDQASYVNGVVIPVDGGETAGIRQPRRS